jgi:exosortase/archaeosortase family protein
LNVGTRFVAWIGLSVALSAVTAPSFPSLVNESLGDAFGGLFVAIPIGALLVLVFAMRWREFVGAMADEGGFVARLPVRAGGAAAIVALVVLQPFTNHNLAASGIVVVITCYAVSLIVNPSTARFVLPYAAVYGAAVGAPAILLWAFGEPLAVLSSGLSAKLVGMTGFPVVWQGTQFQLLSKTGEVVSGVVTPGCSSISSVTMFLGLLALIHLDMKKSWSPTVKLAAAGILILTMLDSVRIVILLWVGYEYGPGAMWGLHDWIGYAMFLGFFLAALPVYFRMGRPASRPSFSPMIPTVRV